ncbi:MAG: HAMP domain-containing protein [Deltaproteobacteria bacterium]|nr:HAMP domain-containing protein [Deltaproteobacteria bacterium]
MWRLFAALSCLLLLSVFAIDLYLTPILKQVLLQIAGDALADRAYLLREHLAVLPERTWTPERIDALADRIAAEIEARVTILDATGRVLGDSTLDGAALQQVENHLYRPEVQAALVDTYGRSTRYSFTVKEEMMYVATRAGQGFVRVALPLQEMAFLRRRVLTGLVGATGLALVAAGFLAWLIARAFTRSWREMADVARQIAGGDLTRRLTIGRSDEFGTLARSINEMGENLQQHFFAITHERNQLLAILEGMTEGVLVADAEGKILLVNPPLTAMLGITGACVGATLLECVRNPEMHAAINNVLQHGVSDHREVFLRETGEKRSLMMHSRPLDFDGRHGVVALFYDMTRIRRLEDGRKEFVANVSHELKTPLTSIRGYTETLRGGALADPAVAQTFIEKIEKHAIQLQALVEDVLQLAESESGRMELHKTAQPLAPAIEAVRADVADFLAEKQLAFSSPMAGDHTVMADPHALKQILANLIENAMQYTPTGGAITVTAVQQAHACAITVADTGIGIPERDLPHIFERFYRVDRARSRDVGGTGLGLAIVKHLVHAHGGEITVASRPGEGSQFTVTLPR